MLTRRDLMIGTLAAGVASPVLAASPFDVIEATLAGGRLGVAAVDLASGRHLLHNADSRFPLCSTFKLPLAAAVLSQVEAGTLSLDQPVRFTRADIVAHAPVVEPALATGHLSVRDLVGAILVVSDNAAANLLLPLVGGPAGLTRFLRRHGDPLSRLDHVEPELNAFTPGNPADTTTPAAMLALTRRLLVRNALKPASQAMLVDWMTQNATGAPRLRAGFPASWRSGDRTGTADGKTNDVAIAWPAPGRAPLIVACYVHAPRASAEAGVAAQAAVGRVAASLVG
jgi:beta-lactamase class A